MVDFCEWLVLVCNDMYKCWINYSVDNNVLWFKGNLVINNSSFDWVNYFIIYKAVE